MKVSLASIVAFVSLGALGGSDQGMGAEPPSGQSLAEIAKKEKERRAKSDETVPVIDDDDLEEARGDGVSVMGVPPDTDSDGDEPATHPDDDAERRPLSAAEVERYRDTWARVWAERLAAAEKELVVAKDAVFQCNSASHFVWVPLAIDCSGVHERLAIAEYEVNELRQNRYNWELLLPERERAPPRD